MVNLYNFTPLKYGDYEMPWWGQAIGWSIALAAIFMIIVGAIIVVFMYWRKGYFQGLTSRQVCNNAKVSNKIE